MRYALSSMCNECESTRAQAACPARVGRRLRGDVPLRGRGLRRAEDGLEVGARGLLRPGAHERRETRGLSHPLLREQFADCSGLGNEQTGPEALGRGVDLPSLLSFRTTCRVAFCRMGTSLLDWAHHRAGAGPDRRPFPRAGVSLDVLEGVCYAPSRFTGPGFYGRPGLFLSRSLLERGRENRGAPPILAGGVVGVVAHELEDLRCDLVGEVKPLDGLRG